MATTVLVVEDDDGIAAPLVRTLEREGYHVVHIDNGLDAVERAGHPDIRLVLLDLGLPDIDGLEVCRRIRDAGSTVAIMMLTARGGELDRVVGLDVGADDYLAKPFAPDELLARVRSLLRRTAAPPRTSSLTAREQEVLRLLADGLNQRDIADALVISPKTVGTHIERILEKLGVHSRVQAVALAYREGAVGAVP
jgi:DNA-binding response OmpR family regulator